MVFSFSSPVVSTSVDTMGGSSSASPSSSPCSFSDSEEGWESDFAAPNEKPRFGVDNETFVPPNAPNADGEEPANAPNFGMGGTGGVDRPPNLKGCGIDGAVDCPNVNVDDFVDGGVSNLMGLSGVQV